MARFTQASIERVKEATDIVEVVSAYTDLRRAGPALHRAVSLPRRALALVLGERDREALPLLRLRGGGRRVQVRRGEGGAGLRARRSRRWPSDTGWRSSARRRIRARRSAASSGRAWARCSSARPPSTRSSCGKPSRPGKAREYLAGRGLGEEMLREFGVGYAPSAWDTVLKRGQSAGYSIAELDGAGLLVKNKQGNPYDRFRSRIIFPIRDARGRVQGFGARAMTPDQKPKYLNSPEGELYRKSRTLYAIERARPAIAKAGRAVVVEGYTDVLAAPPGGDRRDGGGDGHRDHARAGAAARGAHRGGGARPGRRLGGPRGDAARAAGGGRQARAAARRRR